MQKKFAIASDHAGYLLKKELQEIFSNDFQFYDLGTDSVSSVDYPDYAHKMADFLKENDNYMGVLICGSGVGISIAANRHSHIRAALCHNDEIAKLAREHNNANVVVLGARFLDSNQASNILEAFASSDFAAGRHQLRVEKINS